jgi:hypothetical protein
MKVLVKLYMNSRSRALVFHVGLQLRKLKMGLAASPPENTLNTFAKPPVNLRI